MNPINKNEVFKIVDILDKDVLSFKEALIVLDISASTLYKMTHKRTIQFFKPSKKKIYFKKQDLINYMLRNKQATVDEIGNEIDNYLKTSNNG